LLNADLLGDKQKPTESSFFNMLRGQVKAGSVISHPVAWPLTTIEPGIAHGRLLGGNLSMIAATMGTPYELEAEGVILLIEVAQLFSMLKAVKREFMQFDPDN
jgi:muramoyltetrapeptide carboxypeptidase